MKSRDTWQFQALLRRGLLIVLVTIAALLGANFMANALPQPGDVILNDTTVLIFGLLTAWLSLGFWTALFGFFVLVSRRPITPLNNPQGASFPEKTTAIVMPVYNESAENVMANIHVMYTDLARRSAIDNFEFYVLSDSHDPDSVVQEQWAWAELCGRLHAFGKIHYRRRRINIKRKTGNIADFLRRWGQRHTYMIVLDADSLLSADALIRLVTLIQSNPTAAIIQTAPGVIRQRTLFGRVQQFANRLYGPMFAAGLSFWQLGDSYYWGHNAIIRIAPFMQHCSLPRLRGHAPLSGDILSHDFVEAALLRRAGWSTWQIGDLGGSWEEAPPTLLDELKRDRRWCHGNLQHLRVLFAKGILATHRLMFINGAMSYIASVLWFIYLLLGTAIIVRHALVPPNYFPIGHALFPVWPIWNRTLALILLLFTLLVLFLPKILAVVLVTIQGRAREFGGVASMLGSVALEFILSSLLSPVRMLFHTRFVLSSLMGGKVQWGPQQRTAYGTSWAVALRIHIVGTLFATAWGVLIYSLRPEFIWWLLPVLGALVVAIPVSVLSSRVTSGDAARRARLFVTPEEENPPMEVASMEDALIICHSHASRAARGFISAIIDPYVNAVVIARLTPNQRQYSEELFITRQLNCAKLLARGESALSRLEKLAILHDRDLLHKLHETAWALRSVQADKSNWVSSI